MVRGNNRGGTIEGYGAGSDISRPGVITRTFTLEGVLGLGRWKCSMGASLSQGGAGVLRFGARQYNK